MSVVCNVMAVSSEKVQAFHTDPGSILQAAEAPEARVIDTDKAWACIHFLLTGAVDDPRLPLGFLVGGTQVGEVDIGYGPARALSPRETAAVREALELISRDELMSRWDPDAIRAADVYAVNPDAPHSEEEYIGGTFAFLKEFVHGAANDELGLVLWFS